MVFVLFQIDNDQKYTSIIHYIYLKVYSVLRQKKIFHSVIIFLKVCWMKSTLKYVWSDIVLQHRKWSAEIVHLPIVRRYHIGTTNNQAYIYLILNMLFDV